MAHLALLLRECGHDVRGSDQEIYSPMRELLEVSGISFATHYHPSNISDPDVVIIGNAIGRGNAELEAVLDRRIPFRSQAEILKEVILEKRRPIVVAGTHGKTTCTALLAWLLQDLNPGFLVGGIPCNSPSGSRLGAGDPFIVEGDEYDTAFFDKGPKFLHYRPWQVLLNNVEFDHADIYKDFDAYVLSFERLINVIPAAGHLVMYSCGSGIDRIRARARCTVSTFGPCKADYQPVDIRIESNGRRSFSICGIEGRFDTSLIGRHNVMNATGCILSARHVGISIERIAYHLQSFAGVRRRQELVLDGSTSRGVLLYDDFAHHPTAIAETLRAFRECFPGRRLWALFEPRSWSMRKNVFQSALPAAFSQTDRVIIGPVFRKDLVKDSLEPVSVADAIIAAGSRAAYIDSIDTIVETVIADTHDGDVVIVLSNGSFGGLVEKLKKALVDNAHA